MFEKKFVISFFNFCKHSKSAPFHTLIHSPHLITFPFSNFQLSLFISFTFLLKQKVKFSVEMKCEVASVNSELYFKIQFIDQNYYGLICSAGAIYIEAAIFRSPRSYRQWDTQLKVCLIKESDERRYDYEHNYYDKIIITWNIMLICNRFISCRPTSSTLRVIIHHVRAKWMISVHLLASFIW